jgi:tetrahydromethanopterin S-methyltransferase subunit G
MRHTTDERPLSDLFNELAQDARHLVQQEVELAKVEITQKGAKIGQDVGLMTAGAVLGYTGFVFILAAIVFVMATFMPLWLAALIMGVIATVVGVFLVERGRQDLGRRNLMPRQTVQTLKENAQWAREQVT